MDMLFASRVPNDMQEPIALQGVLDALKCLGFGTVPGVALLFVFFSWEEL